MSSPNLPLNENEFFKRKPNDGKTYVYDGTEMSPRVCINSVAFSTDQPSHISFPVYGDCAVNNSEFESLNKTKIDVFPNPCSDIVTVRLDEKTESEISIFSVDGRFIKSVKSSGITSLDISDLSFGTYIIKISNAQKTFTTRIVKE
jgi:hypothetical protein